MSRANNFLAYAGQSATLQVTHCCDTAGFHKLKGLIVLQQLNTCETAPHPLLSGAPSSYKSANPNPNQDGP